MHFGENQLSRSLIGLSPLSTGHPLHFQLKWVRSSTPSYRRFNLPMGRSLRFGSRACDYTALFGLAFATATPHGLTSPHTTNSQAHSSKGTPSPTTRASSDGLYAHGFRYYFTPRQGYFSAFPHGTCPLSVIKESLGLTGGPARFTRNFRSSVLLGVTHRRLWLTHTGLSPSTAPLSRGLQLHHSFLTPYQHGSIGHTTPQPPLRNPCRVSHEAGLASSDFARHYSRNHNCFLFLWVLRCFTSPRSLHTPYFIQAQVTAHDCGWVPPFGHPRITARLPTPQGLSQAPTSF